MLIAPYEIAQVKDAVAMMGVWLCILLVGARSMIARLCSGRFNLCDLLHASQHLFDFCRARRVICRSTAWMTI